MISLKLWLFAFMALWISILWKRRKLYIFAWKIPGPRSYPLIGIAHKMRNLERTISNSTKRVTKFGSLSLFWIGPFPILAVSNPQLAQDILTSPHCVNKSFIYTGISDAIGNGILNMSDPEWSAHRKLLNPAFGHKVLLSFFPIFNREAKDLLKEMNTLVGVGGRDLSRLLQDFTFLVSTQTTMGSNVRDEHMVNNNILLECFRNAVDFVSRFSNSPWLCLKVFRLLYGIENIYNYSRSTCTSFVKKMIEKKMIANTKATDENSSSTDSKIFINLLLEQWKLGQITLKNIEDHSNIVVAAAFETSGKVLMNVILLLAMFPEYQKKVFEEIKEIFPSNGDFEVTYEDIQKMVYLDMILNETMRLLPPIPFILRSVSKETKLSNGLIIPKGVQVLIEIFHIHRSTKIWGSGAATFNPDNFLKTNLAEIHPYGFMPFAKGSRYCIGMNYASISNKLVLAKLIRNYKFATTFAFEDLKFTNNITLKITDMPLVELEMRS